MSKNVNLDLKSLKPLLSKAKPLFTKHAFFTAIITVLLVYVFIVLQINKLASADPGPDAEAAQLSQSHVPSIDQKAIEQIKTLEQNNVDIHTLFDRASNNPFQE